LEAEFRERMEVSAFLSKKCQGVKSFCENTQHTTAGDSVRDKELERELIHQGGSREIEGIRLLLSRQMMTYFKVKKRVEG